MHTHTHIGPMMFQQWQARFALTPTHSLSLSHSLTHSYTHTHSISHTHRSSWCILNTQHGLLSHKHTHTHCLAASPSLSYTHTHTHAHTHTYIHTLTYTHTGPDDLWWRQMLLLPQKSSLVPSKEEEGLWRSNPNGFEDSILRTINYFLQKSPMINGFLPKRDLQLEGCYASLPLY